MVAYVINLSIKMSYFLSSDSSDIDYQSKVGKTRQFFGQFLTTHLLLHWLPQEAPNQPAQLRQQNITVIYLQLLALTAEIT